MRIELAFPLLHQEIFEALGICRTQGDAAIFRALSTDSRMVREGDLFIPLRGERDDGHRYLAEARAKGAAMILTEMETEGGILVKSTREALSCLAKYYHEKHPIPTIAITGSVGKTGAKDAIAAALSARYRTHKTAENQNNELGVAYTLLARPCDAEAVVLELGTNHPGEIRAHAQTVRPDIGVITTIGSAHIGAFGSQEAILKEKLALFEEMKNGTKILNLDDPLLSPLPKTEKTVTVAIDRDADLRATRIYASYLGTSYALLTSEGVQRISLRGMGRPRIYSSLFAMACARPLNVPPEAAAAALLRLPCAEGRQSIYHAGGVLVIDDTYNSSPEAVREGLALLGSIGAGRYKVAILGDMLELGEHTDALHRECGGWTAGVADLLYAFGEFRGQLAEGAKDAGMSAGSIRTFKNAEEVAKAISEELSDGAALLVKASHALGSGVIVSALKERGRGKLS